MVGQVRQDYAFPVRLVSDGAQVGQGLLRRPQLLLLARQKVACTAHLSVTTTRHQHMHTSHTKVNEHAAIALALMDGQGHDARHVVVQERVLLLIKQCMGVSRAQLDSLPLHICPRTLEK